MSKPRKRISTRARFEVFKRDGFTCQYCGAHPPDVTLHVDHVIAIANGGRNDMDNLVTACADCNLGKSSVPLAVAPQSLEQKSAEIAEREAQLVGYQEIINMKRQRIEDDAWRVVDVLYPGRSEINRNMLSSIKMFVDRLGLEKTMEAADIAFRWSGSRSHWPKFRYFCGVCWKRIRGE